MTRIDGQRSTQVSVTRRKYSQGWLPFTSTPTSGWRSVRRQCGYENIVPSHNTPV